MTTFVLVHGGSHGAWCWDPIVTPLEAKGHQVVAVDLPGRDDPHTEVSLDDWVEALGAAVDAVRAPGEPGPILVGHSLGGVTVSQFAERRPNDVAEIVYVNATVPRDGESAMTTFSPGDAADFLREEGALVLAEDGITQGLAFGVGTRAFYNLSPQELAAEAEARMVPEHIKPMSTPVQLGAAYASVPKRWIASTEDRALPYEQQLKVAERIGAPVTSIHADHSPFASATAEFVELLTRG